MQIVPATTQNWKCIQEENELEWELQSKELSFPYERKNCFPFLCISDRDKGKKDQEFRLKNQTRHKPQKISLNPPTLKCYIFIMPPNLS